jgi:hypothetical protein
MFCIDLSSGDSKIRLIDQSLGFSPAVRIGTEPVAAATGLFSRDYSLATASGSEPVLLRPKSTCVFWAKPVHLNVANT